LPATVRDRHEEKNGIQSEAPHPRRLQNAELEYLASRVSYGGNPEHKRNPGDFGLTPPAQPRMDKTLCDEVGIERKDDAEGLLRTGVRKGLVSVQIHNGFPQNIWAVTKRGDPLEAQLENSETGVYHGYPMPMADPLRDEVVARWQRR
jgi:hypothetical protein